MAEPAAFEPLRSAPGPLLGSTADEAPYVPVSWMAVAAASCALLFGLLLAVMGLMAWWSKRPLLEEELLIFAVAAIVLSFAARRMIRNSEGTRTGVLLGVNLLDFAWWGGLVFGLGYLSYYLAIEYSIRKDAQSEVQIWSEQVMKGDEESLNRAFHRTQDPGQRKNVGPTDGAQMEGRWSKDFLTFRGSDLRRLIARNDIEACRVQPGGLRDWRNLPNAIECLYTATFTCPEGTFPLLIPMRGTEAGGEAGRQWQIIHNPSSGFIDKDRARLTEYGWRVAEVQLSANGFARAAIGDASGPREIRAGVHATYSTLLPEDERYYLPLKIPEGITARSAAVGSFAAGFLPVKPFLDHSATRLFRLPGNGKPDDTRLETFKQAWNEFGVVRAGERLREAADPNDRLTFTPDAIVYRFPVEIPLGASQGAAAVARGLAVFECRDASLIADLKRSRESANPDGTSTEPPADLGKRNIPWKLMRIESDLKHVRMEAPKALPPPPGAPPGGPGG